MKFKVGDKVRVINGQSIDIFMDGRECEVIEVDNDSYYQYYITDFNGADWMVERKLELIKEKQMKKEDLKTGMLCKYENGNSYDFAIVFGDRIGYIRNNSVRGWDWLSCFTLCGVVEILDSSNPYAFNDLFNTEGIKIKEFNSIWEREKLPKEMTVSEIAKELGYNIKIVAND